jgi:hypothetical protein
VPLAELLKMLYFLNGKSNGNLTYYFKIELQSDSCFWHKCIVRVNNIAAAQYPSQQFSSFEKNRVSDVQLLKLDRPRSFERQKSLE